MRLKQLRKEHKLKLKDIANELNVCCSTVSQWENGKREMSYKYLKQLANFYGVTTDYILGADTNERDLQGQET